MANNIKGNHDGDGGANDSYTIIGRGVVRRSNLVKEVESGRHPKFSVYKLNNKKYVRANPDSLDTNNIN